MLSICACGSTNRIRVNKNNFPDEVFRDIIKNKYGNTISAKEIKSTTMFDLENKGICDLTGIEYFTFLIELECGNNPFNAQFGIDEPENKISNLDLSNNIAIEEVHCSYVELRTLNIDGCVNLKELYCNTNKLSSLNLNSNIALETLEAVDNSLTEIDLSANTQLSTLYLHNNKLQSLDISKNVHLTQLYCTGNMIDSIDTSQNKELRHLDSDFDKYTKSDKEANTWYTFGSSELIKVQNCKVNDAVPMGNDGVILVTYYPVCQDCHIISERMEMDGVAKNYPVSMRYRCDNCRTTTYVKIETYNK